MFTRELTTALPIPVKSRDKREEINCQLPKSATLDFPHFFGRWVIVVGLH